MAPAEASKSNENDADNGEAKEGKSHRTGVVMTQAQIDKSNKQDVERTTKEAGEGN